MTLHIFGIYKIDVTTEYCYLDENSDHISKIERNKKEITGIELINYINRILSDEGIFELSFRKNNIEIHTFNYLNGTGNDITIQINGEINENKKLV